MSKLLTLSCTTIESSLCGFIPLESVILSEGYFRVIKSKRSFMNRVYYTCALFTCCVCLSTATGPSCYSIDHARRRPQTFGGCTRCIFLSSRRSFMVIRHPSGGLCDFTKCPTLINLSITFHSVKQSSPLCYDQLSGDTHTI